MRALIAGGGMAGLMTALALRESGVFTTIDVFEQTRTPKFPYFQGQQPQTQVLSIDGDVAFNETANGAARLAAALRSPGESKTLSIHLGGRRKTEEVCWRYTFTPP